jgi:hypothetical protein
MRHCTVVFGVLWIACGIVLGQSSTKETENKTVWKEFTAKEGFLVQLPGKPEEKDLAAPTPFGRFEGKEYRFRHVTLRVTFVAAAGRYGSRAKLPEAEKQLKMERDSALEAIFKGVPGGVKVVEEKKIKLDGHLGLALTAELEGKVAIRTRIYVIKRRVYAVSAVGVKQDVFSNDADKFLDSFKLK